ncbi:glutathione S-transferase 1-like [Chrysoperla carnea]|uniref:glutathione S-transferase 1-like n=1 Tax=Chrysoperla carnea TaxID=189513 RepID=UPI001D08D43B|nr:glutathione S-transferase 1-like [Chrysoperla carnea]
MAPKVYGVDLSFPVRGVLLTAKAIDLDIEFVPVNLLAGEHLTPEFKKMNPQHTVPTLDDDGFYLWDSHAIATYLVSKYAKNDSLYPKDLKKRAVVDRLLHFDSGIVFPRARGAFFPILFLNEKTIPEEKKAAIYEAYDFLESFFDGNSWIAGNELTVADLCIIPAVTTLGGIFPIEKSKYPKLLAWIEKCKTLPYFAECNNPGNDGLVAKLKELLSS